MIDSTMQAKPSISPGELSNCLAAGHVVELLDVRTAAEFTAAHVPGARLIPLDELDCVSYLQERGASDKPVYVLCQSGGRASRAIEKFHRAGFKNCVLVAGGTQAWIDAGLPVDRGTTKVLPLMRQVQIVVGLISVIGSVLALAVSPWFALIPLVMGSGLLFAGISGFCGLALVLARMPWNKTGHCKSTSCCSG